LRKANPIGGSKFGEKVIYLKKNFFVFIVVVKYYCEKSFLDVVGSLTKETFDKKNYFRSGLSWRKGKRKEN
jgi:hypothetical protein